MVLNFSPNFSLSLHLQITEFKELAKAFCVFWVGGCSHSGKMQINGKNLRVTFPTRIQLSETYAIRGGMQYEMHGWRRMETRERGFRIKVSGFRAEGRGSRQLELAFGDIRSSGAFF